MRQKLLMPMAKKGAGVLIVVLLIVAVLGIGAIAYGVYQGVSPESGEKEKTATGDCETAPYITDTILNGINKGTPVTGFSTKSVFINDVYKGNLTTGSSGSLAPAYGDKVKIIYDLADYLNFESKEIIVKCGSNALDDYMFATDDGTIKVFSDAGDVLSDAEAGTINQTASATPIVNEIRITTNQDENLGDLICVIEGSNTTEVDDFNMNAVSPGVTVTKLGSIPSVYVTESSDNNAIIKAFEVKNTLKDGGTTYLTLTTTPESGETIAVLSKFFFTCYTEQDFVDDDGTINRGIEDSDGTVTYEDDFDYDWEVGA